MEASKKARDASPVTPRYGSVADLAVYSGLCQKSIRNLIDAGDLKSHKVGRRVLIAFADFDAYVESNIRKNSELS